MLSYLQAVVIGLIQGISELFPVSSLGHSVLLPALIGGSWRDLDEDELEEREPVAAFRSTTTAGGVTEPTRPEACSRAAAYSWLISRTASTMIGRT